MLGGFLAGANSYPASLSTDEQPASRSSANGTKIFIERSVAQGNDGSAHAIRSRERHALNQSMVARVGRRKK